MQAIEIKKSDDPSKNKLSLTTRPIPEPRDGEVLIKVKAAGINRPDLFQVAGFYPPPEGITDIPGLEVAGIIEKGNDVWQEGQEVCALIAGGGYAQYVICPNEQILGKPKDWSFEQAAGLPETLFTVWANLESFFLDEAEDKALLVHGGSSGIGHIAIQLAKAFNVKIAVTAGSQEKLDFCKKLGADLTINHKTEDFEYKITKAWGDAPLTCVLDMVGGDYVEKHLRLLKKYGTHITIATLGGKDAKLDLRAVLKKNLTLKGTTLRPKTIQEKRTIRDSILKHLSKYLDDKRIIPHIFETIPMKDAQKAHEILKSSNHMGKVILIAD